MTSPEPLVAADLAGKGDMTEQMGGPTAFPLFETDGHRPAFAGQVPARRVGSGSRNVYAALDLGTNNCRLLVAEPRARGFRVVDSFSRIVRLGEGLSATGRLGDIAMARTMDALRVCRDKIRARDVTRARLIATEACRAAENGAAFCARVAEETGIQLEIVNRETEAALAAAGCIPLMDRNARGVILFDIGGGSSELVRLDRRQASTPDDPPTISGWASLPVGVVTLAERYGGTHVSQDIYDAMVSDVAQLLVPFARDHGRDIAGMHLLGTSGTVTTIAGIHLGLRRYVRHRVDGAWMNDGEIARTVAQLMAMNHSERVANGCIGAERADLVLAGCAIMDAIRQAFPCPKLRVADRGLREGMLVEMMREDRAFSPAEAIAQAAGPA